MKKFYKILGLSLGLIFILMPKAYAGEIIKYDDSDLDDLLKDHGIDVDEKIVEARKNEEIKKSNSNETINNNPPVKEAKKPVLYPKTPVYSNVVDISEHQKPSSIDYDKFSKDIDGAILRSSITTFDEDQTTKKKTYYLRKDFAVDSHYKELNTRGVPIGFYHYSRATNEKEALREADFVLDFLKDKNVSLPIYIDIEDNMRQAKAGKENLSRAADAFVMAMKNRGYMSGIYSYPYFAKKHLSKEVRNKHEFWIADYEGKNFTGYTDTDFDSWQFAHTGRVAGYKGNIDKNILYRDYPLMIKGKSNKNLEELITEVIEGHWSFGKEREKRLTYAGYNYKLIQNEVNKRLKN